jgi:hypothetical protein
MLIDFDVKNWLLALPEDRCLEILKDCGWKSRPGGPVFGFHALP